jgi:DEAD/DEAH box helicase domain-containing protein
MGENILVLDLETKSIFADHTDRRPEVLGVSLVGTYCYRSGEYLLYREEQFGALEQRLSDKPLLVGFNIRRFDMPALRPYLHFDAGTLPMVDMLEIIHTQLGRRVSLDNTAQATLGNGKSGSGLDAVEYYRQGDWKKLEHYCRDDVKVTRKLFEYGATHREIFYTNKFDRSKCRIPVSWEMTHPETHSDDATQIGLFG